jgi:pimeloyl-ACP methyl ester carboxylesterase
MIRPVTMPKWGLSIERGRITGWFVAEGGDAQAIDAAPPLSKVDVPTTTIRGRQDAVLPPGTADGYVENAGHLVHLEAPGAVISAITG